MLFLDISEEREKRSSWPGLASISTDGRSTFRMQTGMWNCTGILSKKALQISVILCATDPEGDARKGPKDPIGWPGGKGEGEIQKICQ